MHFPILKEIVVLLAFSVVVVFALQKLKLPSILGFLVTGIIIGPYSLGLVNNIEEIEVISEIGVILLLFVIGMEMSIKNLVSIRNTVFVGGGVQVGLTILVVSCFYYFTGKALNESIFVGFLFSLSSTAIVLKILQDRNEMVTDHGKNALAILIFQDIIVVPMMLVTPILTGQSENLGLSLLLLLLKTIGIIGITWVSARFIMPKLLYQIAITRSKELFLITTITICFAVAFLTSTAGLSLALGAFLAGLIISESEYSHQATSLILPFRELFTSIFFISVGMLLDLSFFWNNLFVISILVLLVFLVKSLIAGFSVAILKNTPKTVILTGLSLFQVGEFAFILSKVGIEYNLISPETNQYFLAVSIISMVLTPFVFISSESISMRLSNIKFLNKFAQKKNLPETNLAELKLKDHLVIIGYGINGRNVARAALFSEIPYVIIEFNPETVKNENKKNLPIVFGDATETHILDHVNIEEARVVVLAISNPGQTKKIVKNIRAISEDVHIIVRTRYLSEIPSLLAVGADDVIPEEFETSIEIFSRTLQNFMVSDSKIEQMAESLRVNHYDMFKANKRIPRQKKFKEEQA
jgi:CPA2 family monovalent cation:H+ antiporter-2